RSGLSSWVGSEGFEPPFHGLKGQCLSAGARARIRRANAPRVSCCCGGSWSCDGWPASCGDGSWKEGWDVEGIEPLCRGNWFTASRGDHATGHVPRVV